ncbi:MAG TPA: DNA translocase FtsK, partial [Candidatus Dadabacteria bacterium]|nr:DNA translocase FtsK [Candidatus Dadabacteria bacterium]
ELPNQASLLGKFGSKVAEEYYYFFGLPGLIISVFTTIYLPKFFDEKNPTSFLKKFFFIVLLTFSVGGILKIAKTLGGFTQFKIIGFIPSKITEFLVRNITGILGTSIFYGFLIGLSAWQLNFANRFHPLSSARTLLRSIKGWARKAVPSSNEQDEIKINLNDSSDLKISQEQKVGGAQFESSTKQSLDSNKKKSKYSKFLLPSLDLLDDPPVQSTSYDKERALGKAKIIEEKLLNFGIEGKITEVKPGPVITLYEYKPEPETKINKISSLSNDLAMALKATSVRIIAPIPGKDVVGIEVPNEIRETVYLKDLLSKKQFKNNPNPLYLSLGKDIFGTPFFADLKKAPHLMVGGTTGSGKSVFLHGIITSMLYKASPQDLRFIMIDPKMLELSGYEDIPHLLHPIVTNPKKAAAALKWAVKEMDMRYKLLSDIGVRDIDSYNAKIQASKEFNSSSDLLPFIVIIIDELADLMFVSSTNEVKESITKLSQMARAAGIHLIVASQRPSADVVAGLIKANFPARISFAVSSKTDSRIILDSSGAEKLLGKGDMLLLQPPNNLIRIQGSMISDKERENIADFLKKQGAPEYNNEITKTDDENSQGDFLYEKDELYEQALDIVKQTKQASISMIQRRLKIGYNRAANIIEMMEREGIVGEQESAGKPRKVYL